MVSVKTSNEKAFLPTFFKVLVGVKGGAEHCVAGGLFGVPLARFLVTFFRAEKSNRPPRRRKEIAEENEVGRQDFIAPLHLYVLIILHLCGAAPTFSTGRK